MFNSLRRIFALVAKELLVLLKEPRNRVIMFVPPLIQAMIFGYVATYDLSHVTYVVLDQSRSVASREFLADLDGSGYFRRTLDASRMSEIDDAINRQSAVLGIVISADFARDLARGKPAEVQAIADGRNSNTAGIALGYLGAIAQNFAPENVVMHATDKPPLTLSMRAWYNPTLESRWNMVPSLLGTLTLIQTMMLTAMSVAREREQGTFEQLLVTPLRPGEIMIGKAVPSMMVGLGQATTILLVGQFWFGIPFQGSYFVLYGGLALFLMAAVGIGLMLSAIAANMQQAMLYAFVFVLPTSMLSGFTTPTDNMPEALQFFAEVTPLSHAINIARRVYLEGAGFVEIWPDIWPLAATAALTMPIAAWMFRNRLG